MLIVYIVVPILCALIAGAATTLLILRKRYMNNLSKVRTINDPYPRYFSEIDPEIHPDKLTKPFDFNQELKKNIPTKENLNSDDKMFENATNYSTNAPHSR